MRIYEEYASLFTTQLRSIPARLCSRQPENHDPDDLLNGRDLWVKRKLTEAKQQLRNEHIPFDERFSSASCWKCLSVMFIIDQCCEEIDFFSI
ncbi:putative PEP-binding protein [Shigella sonnei]